MDEKQTSKWIVAATCSAFVLLMAGGGMFALRDQLFAQAARDAAKQTSEREKLASRVQTLDSKLDALAQASKPDTGPIDALNAQLTATTTKLDALGMRLDALEASAAAKKAEPVAVTAAPAATNPVSDLVLSGKPYAEALAAWQQGHPKATEEAAALSVFADKGMPSERALAEQLRVILDSIPATKEVDGGSFVSRLNGHLEGLVKIKKTSSDDPYAALRKQASGNDYAAMLRSVEQLPETQRVPFTAWLNAAHTRAAAIAAARAIAGQS